MTFLNYLGIYLIVAVFYTVVFTRMMVGEPEFSSDDQAVKGAMLLGGFWPLTIFWVIFIVIHKLLLAIGRAGR